VQEIIISADELIAALLKISESEQVCLLDSCGVSHLNSKFLLAGIKPLETHEITDENYEETLKFFDEKLANDEIFAFFTLSYEFGLKLNRLKSRQTSDEPDLFLALFDCLIIHNYDTQKTYLIGNENRFAEVENQLSNSKNYQISQNTQPSTIKSNFTKAEYLAKVEEIKEFIRQGDTYQTNLTQQITAELPANLTPQQIFYNLRKNHPAPFASFLKRNDSFVVSASPERFFKVQKPKTKDQNPIITTSPIKGTRPRGKDAQEDEELRQELLNSEKDRAENVMIVDLLRNDIGRICEFGTVEVEKLFDLEEHPTLFHLVSTVNGTLREKTSISEILKAVFPCGSITGAPKIRTMQIIDQLETKNRGLSMGAIGFLVKSEVLKTKIAETSDNFALCTMHYALDLSVAIRTMTIKNNQAKFNVGGGIVIDSDAESEYEETLTKAKALLHSINGKLD